MSKEQGKAAEILAEKSKKGHGEKQYIPAEILEVVEALRQEVLTEGNAQFEGWRGGIVREEFLESARNFAHYLALRRRDIRQLQVALGQFGLSSLGRLESQVIDNIDAVVYNLRKITGEQAGETPLRKHPAMSKEELDRQVESIFGKMEENRDTSIMVTLPTEAGEDAKLVRELVARGMDVARINCAHVDQKTWKSMIKNVRKAQEETGRDCRVQMDVPGPKARVSFLLTTLQKPAVNAGDTFLLTGSIDADMQGASIALGCSIPEMLQYLAEGSGVMLDDGMVQGRVTKLVPGGALVRVEKVLKENLRLRTEKGLNFPDADIRLPILTEKDQRNLDFICEHADIIGFSFVKSGADMQTCINAIEQRLGEKKARKVAIMPKIETVAGVQNLAEIIVAGASKNPFCFMIARGDLAVEAGYMRLGELQEELLWFAEAARVPVVWATQVLETMVKSGIPSRPEITDAAMGGRAECVMLNKGPYLPEAVSALDDILKRMQEHQYKKTPRLRSLRIAQ